MKSYVLVFAALMVLLAATVGLAYVHMGPFNVVAALLIAIAKSLLVMVFFMHLKEAERMNWIFAVSGFFFLLLLLGFTLADVTTRVG